MIKWGLIKLLIKSVKFVIWFQVTPELMRYTERFEFPYITDVTNYEKLAKIGQGTFG